MDLTQVLANLVGLGIMAIQHVLKVLKHFVFKKGMMTLNFAKECFLSIKILKKNPMPVFELLYWHLHNEYFNILVYKITGYNTSNKQELKFENPVEK